MKIAVMGVAGRMGQQLVRAIHEAEGCTVAGATERPDSPVIGADVGTLAGIGPIGVTVSDDPLEVIANSEGILDFTAPKATVEFAELAANARIVHVIGTTGLTPADEAHIAAAARHAPIIKAGNMSLGVTPSDRHHASGRRGAGRGLRHRDRGDAPQRQGRCTLGHRAHAGPSCGRGARHRS